MVFCPTKFDLLALSGAPSNLACPYENLRLMSELTLTAALTSTIILTLISTLNEDKELAVFSTAFAVSFQECCSEGKKQCLRNLFLVLRQVQIVKMSHLEFTLKLLMRYSLIFKKRFLYCGQNFLSEIVSQQNYSIASQFIQSTRIAKFYILH